MKEEFEKQLVAVHPDFFSDYRGNPMETCMAWGMEHGDGWFNLLSDLCQYINLRISVKFAVKAKHGYSGDEVDSYGYINLAKPRFYFQQIKEKFGTLTIYYSLTHDIGEYADKIDEADYDSKYEQYYQTPISQAIDYVEYISSKYCEDCGKRGKVYYDGWYKALCPDCAKEQDRDDYVDIKDAP